MWLNFLVYGVSLSIAFWTLQRKKLAKILRVFLVSSLFCIVLFYSYLFNQIYLGSDSWYNKTPYLEIIYFVLMLFGMSARYITKSIEERRDNIVKLKNNGASKDEVKNVKLEFDLYEFSYPFFFSVITFGLLLKQITIQDLSVSNVILSFQTGFFWQTVLKKEIK